LYALQSRRANRLPLFPSWNIRVVFDVFSVTEDGSRPRLPPAMKRSLHKFLIPAGATVVLLAISMAGVPIVSVFAQFVLTGLVITLVVWLAIKIYQAFLWKVGRRLAFTYFLIGIVPIPMVALLALAVSTLLSSFFLSHLYRTAVEKTERDLLARAEQQLSLFIFEHPAPETRDGFAFDYYFKGQRVSGAGLAGEDWPAWLTEPPTPAPAPSTESAPSSAAATPPEGVARYVVGSDGYPTLAVAVEEGDWGLTAVYLGSLAELLRKRSGVWVDLERVGDVESLGVVTIRDIKFRSKETETSTPPEIKEDFFTSQAKSDGFLDKPKIWAWYTSGSIYSISDGAQITSEVRATLNSTPRAVFSKLLSDQPEQDIEPWIALLVVAAFLLSVYGVAVLLALAMIFGLSRAVNHLSRATAAVRRGDFSVRIPVYRRDQLGELQRSFNQMSAEMEGLVATAAQKEALEKELEIARQLQESLLPTDLPRGDAIDFATLFEPSAAIGGDYFDILRLDETHVAVVIADVSGHGLSSGLRMAMIKAALQILVDSDTRPEPGAIFSRLDSLVRANAHDRFFVTATLGLLDTTTGVLEITSAGHPPTYLLRAGGVQEIIIPSSPLGILGNVYESREIQLESGDYLVWMSDGLIEATNHRDDAFGYDRTIEALSGDFASPTEVRGRLLAAVDAHAEGREPDDDRTLVVMRYQKRS